MNKFKFFIYSFLSIGAAGIAWLLYFLAHHVSKFSNAWESGADHYFNKLTERA
jgi:hypothetical protein